MVNTTKRAFITGLRKNLAQHRATITRLTLERDKRKKYGMRLGRYDASDLKNAQEETKYILRELRRLSVPGSTVIHKY